MKLKTTGEKEILRIIHKTFFNPQTHKDNNKLKITRKLNLYYACP